MNRKLYTRILIISIIIAAAIAWRFFNVIPNATPVAAIALFSGAYMGRKWLAMLIPMLIMFISDIFLGFHETMIAVYLSFALVVALGFLLARRVSPVSVTGFSLLSSVVFYLVSNFGVWLSSMAAYPKTLAGLAQCYVAAIPFFRSEVVSTLAFSFLFFGAYALLRRRVPALA
jgi:hypothetical protein